MCTEKELDEAASLPGYRAVDRRRPRRSASLASHAQPRSTSFSRERPDYQGAAAATGSDSRQALLKRYCITCHNERLKTGNLALDTLDLTQRRCARTRRGRRSSASCARRHAAGRAAAARRSDARRVRRVARRRSSIARRPLRPDPGRTETFHRLNRAEYQNAVRDLLALDVDVADLLPADDASYGFDNIAGVLRDLAGADGAVSGRGARRSAAWRSGRPLPAVDSRCLSRARRMRSSTITSRVCRSARAAACWSRHTVSARRRVRHQASSVTGGDRDRANRSSWRWRSTASRCKLVHAGAAQRGAGATVYDSEDKLDARVPVTAGPRDVGVAFSRSRRDLVEQAARAVPESAHLGQRRRARAARCLVS